MEKIKNSNYSVKAGIFLLISVVFTAIDIIVDYFRYDTEMLELNNIFSYVQILTSFFLVFVLFLRKRDKLLVSAVTVNFGINALVNVYYIIMGTINLIRGDSYSFLFYFYTRIINIIILASDILIILLAFSIINKKDKPESSKKKIFIYIPAGLYAVYSLLDMSYVFIMDLYFEIKYFYDIIDFFESMFRCVMRNMLPIYIPVTVRGIINVLMLIFLALWIVNGEKIIEKKKKDKKITPAPAYNPAYGQRPAQPYNQTYGQRPAQPYNPAYGQRPAQPYNPAYGQNPAQPYNPAYGQNPAQPYNPAYGQRPAQPYNPAYGQRPAQPYNPAYGQRPAQPYNPAYTQNPAQSLNSENTQNPENSFEQEFEETSVLSEPENKN